MKLRTTLIGVVLLAVCLWWAWPDHRTTVPTRPGAAATASVGEAAVAEVVTVKSSEPAVSAKEVAATSRQLLVETMTIMGRCVSGKGKPLGGVPLRLRLRLRRQEMHESCWEFPGAPHVPDPVQWRAPESVTSTADGTFSFRLALTKLLLRIDAGGRYAVDPTQTRLFDERHEGPVLDAGDVVVHEGSQVRGSVVDQFGRPLSSTLLVMGHRYGYPAAKVIDGRVDFGAVPASDYAVTCPQGPVTPDNIDVGPGFDTSDVRFVVQCLPVLTCLAVDDRTGE